MINLIKAEATRWRSRRMLWIFALVTLLAFAGLATLVFFFTKAPSASQAAEIDRVYQQQYQDWEANHEAEEASCLAESAPEEQEFCAQEEPTREDFTFKQPVQEMVPVLTVGGGAILALVGFIISASYIGAEMSSGAIANWLTFSPSRWKVLLSKLVVALLGAAVFTAVFVAFSFIVIAAIHGVNGDAEGPIKWTPLVQQGGRTVALAAIVATVGFTIALIARHTAAALGALGVFFVARIITGIFGTSEKFAGVQPWLPDNNALAFLLNDYPYFVTVNKVTPDGVQQEFAERVVTLEHGLVYLLVCFAVAAVVSFVVFQRRDVN